MGSGDGRHCSKGVRKETPSPYFKKIKIIRDSKPWALPLDSYKRLPLPWAWTPASTVAQIAASTSVGHRANRSMRWWKDKKSPCKGNILLGKDADLFKLPGPMVHDGDGGRYLCTWHFVVAKDPDNGMINWACIVRWSLMRRPMVGLCSLFPIWARCFTGSMSPEQTNAFCHSNQLAILFQGWRLCASPIPEDKFTGMLM